MNTQKQRRKELVAALRSGNYKQGNEFLFKEGKFCCLGVACDISGLGRWQIRPRSEDIFLYLDKDSVLPEEVMDYFGFVTELGQFTPEVTEDHDTTLAYLNDESKLNFNKIADIIESEPKGMFV